MKFEKISAYEETTIRIVWRNDFEMMFGVVGTVEDMLNAKIVKWCELSHDLWVFLPAPGVMKQPYFGKTREEALEELEDLDDIIPADEAINARADQEAKYDRFIDGDEA